MPTGTTIQIKNNNKVVISLNYLPQTRSNCEVTTRLPHGDSATATAARIVTSLLLFVYVVTRFNGRRDVCNTAAIAFGSSCTAYALACSILRGIRTYPMVT